VPNNEDLATTPNDKVRVEEVDFIDVRKITPANRLVLFTFKRTQPVELMRPKIERAN
jgi:hypothetical protein